MKKLFLLLMAVVSFALCASAQTVTVRGTVLSAEDNEPLVGASVKPLGGGTGVITDIDGNFTLHIPATVKKLEISYVGCQSVRVDVAPQITVKLKSSNALDEVVVLGYGSAKKLGSVVGSVGVVSSDAIVNNPATTVIDALQGQVSGLSVMSASGDPSSPENQVRMRGVNSLNSSTEPLYILDGAPITYSVFVSLNPGDIESVTVLKDAASTAIYGTRAANGVIVVTSKKGKFGENASVTVRASMGWSQMVSDKANMMNSKQYSDYRKLIGNPLSEEAQYAVDVLGISTNWRDEIFDSNAPTYNLEGTIRGGSESISYYIGLSHYDQQGIIDQSGLRRDVLRTNLEGRVNDWFKVGLMTNLGYVKYQTNNESNAIYGGSGIYQTNPMFFSRTALPFDSPRYYTIEDGKAVFGEEAMYLHFTQRPTPKYIQEGRSVWRNRLTINAVLYEQIQPITGLILRAQQAVDAYDSRIKNYGFAQRKLVTPMGDVYDNGATGDLSMGYNQQSFSRYSSFTYTNTAEYTRTFNDLHDMSVLIGQEAILSHSEGFGAFTDGYTNNRLLFWGQGTEPAQVTDLSQSMGSTVMNSYFAAVNYNYDNRYFFSGTFRRDGSSKFPTKDRWGNFYSLGVMWDLQNEKFLNNVSWLDDLKLRLSYGTSGNSGISNYLYYGLVGGSSTTYNGGSVMGIAQQSVPDLTWETVRGFDLGLSFGLFNHLDVEAAFYHKETVDMLMEIPYSPTTGFSGGIGNIGSMKNVGVDIDVNASVIKTKDWYWGLKANFNYNHNEITELFGNRDYFTLNNTGVRYEVGHNASEFYMVRYAGVDPRDGKQMWYTKEGNLTKVYNEERDAVMTGKSQYSPLSGGFGTELRWKGLSLTAHFAWAAKKYMTNNDRYFTENNSFGAANNQNASMLNVWTHPGQITDIPKVGETIQFDTHLLEDASFLRLKNLTVQYQLPEKWLKPAKLKGASIHFTGRNLLTITDYTGYDPEPETNVVAFFYPNTRQYEFGLEVSF